MTKQLPHRHHDPVVTVDGTPATPHLDAGSADHPQEADHELVLEMPVRVEVPRVGLGVGLWLDVAPALGEDGQFGGAVWLGRGVLQSLGEGEFRGKKEGSDDRFVLLR